MSLALRLRGAMRRADPAPEPNGTILTQRRIYILPTRAGVLFGATVLTMLLGCINYNLGLGFLLTFLVGGIGIMSILHTFRNLAQLRVAPARAAPVFAGELAVFPIMLSSDSEVPRHSIGLRSSESAAVFVDVPPQIITRADVKIEAPQRGRLFLGRVRVFTTFPLGLFQGWSYVSLDSSCMVYPKPEMGVVPLPPHRAGEEQGLELGQGQDDFAGLRKYHPGDSLRHVAWKAVARGQPLMTKQFYGLAAGELWLDWHELPRELRTEARLSRLTRWIIDCTRAGHSFGLRMPNLTIAPGSGAAHEEQCLTALALFR